MKLFKPITLGLVSVSLFLAGAVLSPTKVSEADTGGSFGCPAGQDVVMDPVQGMYCVPHVEPVQPAPVPTTEPVTTPDSAPQTKTPGCTP